MCVKPSSLPLAKVALAKAAAAAAANSSSSSASSHHNIRLCTVVGFPHGSSSASVKITEAAEACASGAVEVGAVVNIGKVLGGEWTYIESEIEALDRIVTTSGALLKVILEADYLPSDDIARLCEICTARGVAFVETSTGYSFKWREHGDCVDAEAYSNRDMDTVGDLVHMRQNIGPEVRIKATGGVRNLDELLYVLSLGVERVGTSSTEKIMEEARARGIGEAEVEVELTDMKGRM